MFFIKVFVPLIIVILLQGIKIFKKMSHCKRTLCFQRYFSSFFFPHSNLSLTGEDADFPESMLPGSFSDDSRMKPCNNRQSLEKPLKTKRGHLQEVNSRRSQNGPVSGSLTDIPVLLVNGAPQQDLHSPEPQIELLQRNPVSKPTYSSSQARFNGSQPSMKFVMDTSKFWFRPHISRAEGETQASITRRPYSKSTKFTVDLFEEVSKVTISFHSPA